jgi:hypothetical protein
LGTNTRTVADGKNELLDAEDAAALTALSTNSDLRKAYNSIAHLGKKYGVSTESAREEQALEATAEDEAQLLEAQRAGQEVGVEPPKLTIGSWVHDANDVTVTEEPVTVTDIDPHAGFLPPWVLPALGGIVALVAVLVAEIYPEGGEPFGTTKDYLAAFVAGATGTAVAQFLQGPLAAFVTRLRPGA